MTKEIPEAWVITGGPAAGKSTVLDILCNLYKQKHGIPLYPFDPDVTFGKYNEAMLELNGLPPGDYESDFFKEHLKPRNYGGTIDAARFAREHDCPVVITAPFTSQIRTKEKWRGVVNALGGGAVHMAYVLTNQETMLSNMRKRRTPPDLAKLKDPSDFLARIDLDTPPVIDHYTIDNREEAEVPLQIQVAQMLAKAMRSN